MRRIFLGLVMALCASVAQAATLRGEIRGVIIPGIDNTGIDGLGLFGPAGGVLIDQKFRLFFDWDTALIQPQGGGEVVTLTRLRLVLPGGSFDLGAGGQVALLPFDLMPERYEVSFAALQGSLDLVLQSQAMTGPVPFSLTSSLAPTDTYSGDAFFSAVQRDALGAETGRSDLLLETQSIRVAAVPLPAGGLLLVTALIFLRRRR